MLFPGIVYLRTGQSTHEQQLILQPVVLIFVSARRLCSAWPLEACEGDPAGFGVEGVDHDGLRTFDLAAAERAALALGLLRDTTGEISVNL